MPAVAASRGAQHPVAVAPSPSRRVAAARCKRARLPDAHEEMDGSQGSPERGGGAPTSRGGGRPKGKGWTVLAIRTAVGRSTPSVPTVRLMRRARLRLDASQVIPRWGQAAAGRPGRWPWWFGGLPASAAGGVVRARPYMFVETPHRHPARPSVCPGAALQPRCSGQTVQAGAELRRSRSIKEQ